MRVEHLDIDSRVLGRSVLAIYDFDHRADFPAFERAYRERFDPFYVS